MGISALGQDVLCEILLRLDPLDLNRASRVNKAWHKAAEQERVWQVVANRKGWRKAEGETWHNVVKKKLLSRRTGSSSFLFSKICIYAF